MTQIKDLQPVEVWRIFDQMLQIPRPSNHEAKIQDWAVQFGRQAGLESFKDEAGNVIIKKPASAGMDNRPGVILQGHLDMVPQKNSDKQHDFQSDPIDAFVDGDWVTANGTTLGADNGIGVAAAMAVLESNTAKHGPLEVLLTATEETGMHGAKGLKAGVLEGEILVNLDSEDEGELFVGCAGGEDASMVFAYSEMDTPAEFTGFKLSVSGLKGGHSGIDIPLGRGNSNTIFFRILLACRNLGVQLASVDGGSLRNAIPRETFGIISLPKAATKAFSALVSAVAGDIKAELSATEPDLDITLESVALPSVLINERTLSKLTAAVVACPNGVIRMSDSMHGLVETSSNLAIVKSDANSKTISCGCLMRSSVDTARSDLAGRIQALFELAGATVTFKGAYAGWKPDMDSAILNTMRRVYQHTFAHAPKINAIHAGLECGILGSRYPHWDMISFGPTIRFPHSPDEKVKISSVQQFWAFLLATLESIPEK